MSAPTIVLETSRRTTVPSTTASALAEFSSGGPVLTAVLTAVGEREGDHCRHAFGLRPSDGFLMDDASHVEFCGEIERPVVAAALRWLADRLEELETEA